MLKILITKTHWLDFPNWNFRERYYVNGKRIDYNTYLRSYSSNIDGYEYVDSFHKSDIFKGRTLERTTILYKKKC